MNGSMAPSLSATQHGSKYVHIFTGLIILGIMKDKLEILLIILMTTNIGNTTNILHFGKKLLSIFF